MIGNLFRRIATLEQLPTATQTRTTKRTTTPTTAKNNARIRAPAAAAAVGAIVLAALATVTSGVDVKGSSLPPPDRQGYVGKQKKLF